MRPACVTRGHVCLKAPAMLDGRGRGDWRVYAAGAAQQVALPSTDRELPGLQHARCVL